MDTPKIYAADLETNTHEDDVRVWAWGAMNIYSKRFEYGSDIDSFIAYMFKNGGRYYFHNLKFDGVYILIWLLENGWEYTDDIKPGPKQFNAIIDNMGKYYQIKIPWKSHARRQEYITIRDSLKLIPFAIRDIAIKFKMDEIKGDIDYSKIRIPGEKIDPSDLRYLYLDVKILADALTMINVSRETKMTTSAECLKSYKEIIGGKKFREIFPVLAPEVDAFCRKSYRGGWSYVKKSIQGKEIGAGIRLDVNSLYPYVMHERLIPYGEPKYFKGEYKETPGYLLYIQRIQCVFKLKPNHLPMIQLKKSMIFSQTEYIEECMTEQELVLTNVDLKLFLEHYDVMDSIQYIDGYMFKASGKLYTKYLDYWIDEKVDAGEKGDLGRRQIAKDRQNCLYGKFGSRIDRRHKKPYLKDGILKYELSEKEDVEPVYIPAATFITAWARDYTIRAAQSQYDRFCYSDTDSLHLEGEDLPENLEIDANKLGAFKHEATFSRAKFLRAKRYIEDEGGELHVTCAGMPKNLWNQITWQNFDTRLPLKERTFKGKLVPKHVKGGILLTETTFTLQE